MHQALKLFFGSGEDDFLVFLPYLGMAAIFNDAEPFVKKKKKKNRDSTLSAEGPIWNLVKIAVQRRRCLKITRLFICI